MKTIVYKDYGPPEFLHIEEAVEAHRYVESGQKRGNVVIIME